MKGRRWVPIAGLALVIAVMPETLIAQSSDTRPSVTYDGVEYFLPAPRDKIVLPTGIPATHTVVAGDTLWGIARQYLQDPFLWPLVWEANIDQVSNPHLIYPGQVLALLEGTVVPAGTEGGTPASRESLNILSLRAFRGKGRETIAFAGTRLAYEDLFDPHGRRPGTSDTVVNTAGFIAAKPLSVVGQIIDAELPFPQIAIRQVVYLDVGTENDIVAGQELEILRQRRSVYHPVTEKPLGTLFRQVGRVRVVCAKAKTSIAVVSKAYFAVHRGDLVTPYTPRQSPMTVGSPESDVCQPAQGDISGYIVDAAESPEGTLEAALLGPGDVVYIDAGKADSVEPGQYYVIFRPSRLGPEFPEIQVGEMMVVAAEDRTATSVIVRIRQEVQVGDRIQLK